MVVEGGGEENINGFASLWTSVVSWYTPTIFFCLLNLTIATIYLLSPTNPLKKSHTNNNNNNNNQQQQQQQQQQDNYPQSQNAEYQNNPYPTRLARPPSLLERVKSINYSLYRSESNYPSDETRVIADHQSQHHSPADQGSPPEEEEEEEEEEHHVTRTQSAAAAVVAPVSVPAKLKRWASEKFVYASTPEDVEEMDRRRPATVREGKGKKNDDEGGVDAKADDFINRFKQQLKLQRLDSILRYKEILGRGT